MGLCSRQVQPLPSAVFIGAGILPSSMTHACVRGRTVSPARRISQPWAHVARLSRKPKNCAAKQRFTLHRAVYPPPSVGCMRIRAVPPRLPGLDTAQRQDMGARHFLQGTRGPKAPQAVTEDTVYGSASSESSMAAMERLVQADSGSRRCTRTAAQGGPIRVTTNRVR